MLNMLQAHFTQSAGYALTDRDLILLISNLTTILFLSTVN